jgi:DNA-binding PadR family transcriptional regulator
MISDVFVRPEHEHSSAWPHDDTHHVVAAFALLLFERGVTTTDELSVRLVQLHVVRSRIAPDSLASLIEDLESTGLIVAREAADQPAVAYEVTPAGRAVVDDWVAIMRDRRHVTRTFLALYDRTDE